MPCPDPPVTASSIYSSSRYLRAKETVDRRSLNQRVWARFVEELMQRESTPIRILEVGGGVGATAKQIIEALEEPSIGAVEYTFVDIDPEHVQSAKEALRAWARNRGFHVSGQGGTQEWTGGLVDVTVRFVPADLFDLPAIAEDTAYDAVVAQSVFDLLEIPNALDALDPLIRPDGLWYLPLHFDGVTAFEPSVEPDLDAKIERLYHESMGGAPDEEGGRAGAHCGRRLLCDLRNASNSLLEVGSSDWIIIPQKGEYSAEEEYFLQCILHFIETELAGHPDLADDALNHWLDVRRQQTEAGELIYIAHQLDVLARGPG